MYGQIIPFTPKNYKKNENNEINTKDKKDKSESNEKKEKEKDEIKKEYSDPKLKEKEKEKDITIRQPLTTTTAIFIPPMPMANAIFLNQVQNNKNYYNKFQTKKRTCFAGRTGDWTCASCRNLNFAFRVVCNRCKLPKPQSTEKKEVNDDNNNNKKNNFENNKNRFMNKNKYKYKKNYQYYNETNSNNSKTQEEK